MYIVSILLPLIPKNSKPNQVGPRDANLYNWKRNDINDSKKEIIIHTLAYSHESLEIE